MKPKKYELTETIFLGPTEYTCVQCKNHFSGIWEHFKLMDCEGIYFCGECFSTSLLDKHRIAKVGATFNGIKILSLLIFFLLQEKENLV